jgi:hypothetical protein
VLVIFGAWAPAFFARSSLPLLLCFPCDSRQSAYAPAVNIHVVQHPVRHRFVPLAALQSFLQGAAGLPCSSAEAGVMLVERRGQVIAIWLGSTGNGRNPMFNGRRQPSRGGTSRMMREYQVRFCERLGVKLPGPTRQKRRKQPRPFVHALPLLPQKLT